MPFYTGMRIDLDKKTQKTWQPWSKSVLQGYVCFLNLKTMAKQVNYQIRVKLLFLFYNISSSNVPLWDIQGKLMLIQVV